MKNKWLEFEQHSTPAFFQLVVIHIINLFVCNGTMFNEQPFSTFLWKGIHKDAFDEYTLIWESFSSMYLAQKIAKRPEQELVVTKLSKVFI